MEKSYGRFKETDRHHGMLLRTECCHPGWLTGRRPFSALIGECQRRMPQRLLLYADADTSSSFALSLHVPPGNARKHCYMFKRASASAEALREIFFSRGAAAAPGGKSSRRYEVCLFVQRPQTPRAHAAKTPPLNASSAERHRGIERRQVGQQRLAAGGAQVLPRGCGAGGSSGKPALSDGLAVTARDEREPMQTEICQR